MPSLFSSTASTSNAGARTLSRVTSFKREWGEDDDTPKSAPISSSASDRLDWSPSPEPSVQPDVPSVALTLTELGERRPLSSIHLRSQFLTQRKRHKSAVAKQSSPLFRKTRTPPPHPCLPLRLLLLRHYPTLTAKQKEFPLLKHCQTSLPGALRSSIAKNDPFRGKKA
jgi:hypothetical protein